MINPGLDEKIYPVVKLATVVDALATEGVAPGDALQGVRLSKDAIASPATRVSLNQVIECYRNADRLAREPHFAFNAGLRLHVAAYGMYGFAILSSMNYRQTMQFAMQYHQLATPLTTMVFSEQGGCGIWTITPVAKCSSASFCRCSATLWALRLPRGSSMSHLARRPTRRAIGSCSAPMSCSANPKTDFCSTRLGSMARRISATR
jgi:hypothetical protein